MRQRLFPPDAALLPAVIVSLAGLAAMVIPVRGIPAPAGATGSDAATAREILDRVDDLFRGTSSHGRMTMTITTEHWTRSLTMEFWSRGKDRSLIRILSPRKERGTATLRSGNDIWNYLPKVDRVIRLPSSMMSASWMGSHFTNDDLVRESRMVEDYTFEVTFDGVKGGEGAAGDRGPAEGGDGIGEAGGTPVIEITCLPKPEAPVVWGKAVVTVRRPDLLPLEILYYDEDLDLARTMTFSDFRPLGGRVRPARTRIVPADRPGESTDVVYEEIEFDMPLDDDLFSIRSLQR
jgi:outer membrane lipoprotein-sorting protein